MLLVAAFALAAVPAAKNANAAALFCIFVKVIVLHPHRKIDKEQCHNSIIMSNKNVVMFSIGSSTILDSNGVISL
jgi:hypothetical protein